MQMDYFFDKIGRKYNYGLQKIENIWIIIASIDSYDTHLAQPLAYTSYIFEKMMSDEWGGMNITSEKIEIVNAFLESMKDYYRSLKQNNILKNKIEVLEKSSNI